MLPRRETSTCFVLSVCAGFGLVSLLAIALGCQTWKAAAITLAAELLPISIIRRR